MSFKETEIGMIPEEWKIVSLGEVADVISGYAFKRVDFIDKGIPVIKIKNIVPPNISLDDVGYVSKKVYYEKTKYQLSYNDILISMTGSNVNQFSSAVGKVGRVKLKNQKLLLNQRVGKIEVNNSKFDEDFLYYIISTDDTKWRLASSAGGSANQANISPKQIRALKLPCPDLKEQQLISSILSLLDAKIETNNQINKNLEEMAQAIFKHWFVDFEFPDKEGKPYKFSGGEMIESELGMIPKGWDIRSLNEISTDIITGKTPSTKVKENYGGNIPFVKIPDMHDNVYITRTESYLSENGINKNKILPKNSVIVSCIATPGLVSLASEECQTNQQINSLILTNKKMCYFAYFMLKNLSQYIRILGSTGSATLNLNKTEFSKIRVVIPNNEIIDEYYCIVKPNFEMIMNNEISSMKLKNIRDTLLPKLMSGEIRVAEDNGELRMKNGELQNN